MAMMVMGLNVWGVLAALVFSNVLGMTWFSMSVFGKAWAKGRGWSKKDMSGTKGMAKSMFLNVLGTLVTIVVLAYIVKFTAAMTWQEGASLGFWLWLGFVMPVKLGDVLWAAGKWNVFLIESAYQLVNLAVMGAILAVL